MRYTPGIGSVMAPTIRCTSFVDDDAICVLTISNPRKRNALTPSMLSLLATLLPSAPASPHQPLRAVIIEGDGATFSSGFDLAAISGVRDSGVDPITVAAAAIAACPVPVIAAVDGACYGGAVELLAACALRVTSSSARFAVPAVHLGLVYPASGLRRFRRLLGHNAERVLLVGRVFSAADACAWGLVHDVVDDARAFARALARDIAAAAPLAVAGTLGALRAIDNDNDDNDDEVINDFRAAALGSADLDEGVCAANEKRPATFAGR